MSPSRILALVLVISLSAYASSNPNSTQLALMPVPASIHVEDGKLRLDATFKMAVSGYSDARFTSAMLRLQSRIAERTGVTLVPRLAEPSAAKLLVQVQSAGEEYPKLGEDEFYKLVVTADHATLTANTVVGALRGMQTFLQLVSGDSSGYFLPAVSIQDQPRFPWRGLMIDVARHFMPVEVIKRNIDGMAAVKMNVLHLHLSDDQGFRIESRKFPKLQGMGSDGLYYTQEQIRDIVAYAADRGIRVVPEFDMPGHATAWVVGYPELASAPGPYQLQRSFAVFDTLFDPTREETYRFLDAFFGEMAPLFPDEFVHIGGDEVNGKQWAANPRIQQFMTEQGFTTTTQLQAYFTQRVAEILKKHGKHVAGWDEILSPNLPADAVVQGWHGTGQWAMAARQGHITMWSAPYYLDQMAPAEWSYSADPVPEKTTLTPDEAARIIGGEVCAWSEYLSPENIDSRIWPRTAAIAERFWSPREVRDVADMYRRLDIVSVGLQQEGLKHESSPAEMLRQAAGTRDLGPVAILGTVASPEGVGPRQKIRLGDVFDPLVHVADSVSPDPPFRRRFAALAEEYLSDAPTFMKRRSELGQTFAAWQGIPRSFSPTEAGAPLLSDCDTRVYQLSALGTTGIQAMNYLQSDTVPPESWRDEALALISQAEKPDASLLALTWTSSYRALILAAVHVDRLKSTPPAEWERQIFEEAISQTPKPKYTW